MAGPITVKTNTSGVADLARDIRRGAPAVWPECRRALLAAATPVQQEAVARVRAWARATPPGMPSHQSGRGVAASIHVRVTAGGQVEVVAGGAQAPEAAPIENKGRGFVRHKVFGHPDRWTSKNSHAAFLAPAFDKFEAQAAEAVEEAVVRAVERTMRGY